MSVYLYVANGRPNGWADQDQTWHRAYKPTYRRFCEVQIMESKFWSLGGLNQKSKNNVSYHMER